jgi:hypothetical protein
MVESEPSISEPKKDKPNRKVGYLKMRVMEDLKSETINNEVEKYVKKTASILSAGTNLDANSFTIYPNPVDNVLNVKTNSDMEKVELYDIQGRLLQTHINKTLETSIHIDRYQTGTYFVKIYTSTGVGVQKVMKK